jgi:hypothetical protein
VLLVVVEPPLQLTVAPDRAAPDEALVTLPVTVPLPAVLETREKFAVTVAPAATVTFCVTLWNPVAETTNCTVPVGTDESV